MNGFISGLLFLLHTWYQNAIMHKMLYFVLTSISGQEFGYEAS